MDKIKCFQYQYILDEDEAKLVRDCLLYCRHRLNRHKYCGLKVDDKKVEQLVKEFFNEV